MKSYAEIAKPLHELTKKEEKFTWTKERDNAFIILKKCLVIAPIFGYPETKEPFILYTDASGCSIGGELSQIQDGQEWVIAYGSKVLIKEERNYRKKVLKNRPWSSDVVVQVQRARRTSS